MRNSIAIFLNEYRVSVTAVICGWHVHSKRVHHKRYNLSPSYKVGVEGIKVSFAQWQYHSQWGPTEAWLLLIENLSQYPVMTTWKTVGFTIFGGHYGGCNKHYVTQHCRCAHLHCRYQSPTPQINLISSMIPFTCCRRVLLCRHYINLLYNSLLK